MNTYIAFLVPNSALISDTLHLSEFEKAVIQSEAITKNDYVRIVEFTSGSAITIAVGFKDEYQALKENGLIK